MRIREERLLEATFFAVAVIIALVPPLCGAGAVDERARVAAVEVRRQEFVDTSVAGVIELLAAQFNAKAVFDDRAKYAARMDCHLAGTTVVEFLEALGEEHNFSIKWTPKVWEVWSHPFERAYEVRHLSAAQAVAAVDDLRLVAALDGAKNGEVSARYDAQSNSFVVSADRAGQEAARAFLERLEAKAQPVRLAVGVAETSDSFRTSGAVLTSAEAWTLLEKLPRAEVKVADVPGGSARHFEFSLGGGTTLRLDLQPIIASEPTLFHLSMAAELRRPVPGGAAKVEASRQDTILRNGNAIVVRMDADGQDAGRKPVVVVISLARTVDA